MEALKDIFAIIGIITVTAVILITASIVFLKSSFTKEN